MLYILIHGIIILDNIFTMADKKLSIAMVSDFFYPKFGGVETHIHQLALCLIEKGHKVIMLTRSYG